LWVGASSHDIEPARSAFHSRSLFRELQFETPDGRLQTTISSENEWLAHAFAVLWPVLADLVRELIRLLR